MKCDNGDERGEEGGGGEKAVAVAELSLGRKRREKTGPLVLPLLLRHLFISFGLARLFEKAEKKDDVFLWLHSVWSTVFLTTLP